MFRSIKIGVATGAGLGATIAGSLVFSDRKATYQSKAAELTASSIILTGFGAVCGVVFGIVFGLRGRR